MKRNLLNILALTVLLSVAASAVMAQQQNRQVNPNAGVTNNAAANPSANAQPQGAVNPVVAIVDMEYLLAVHPEFYAKSRELLARTQAKQQEFRGKEEALQVKRQELNALTAGTQSHAQKRDELLKMESDIQSQAATAMDEIQLQALQARYKAIKDIQRNIDQFAKSNRFVVVLNYIKPTTVLPPDQLAKPATALPTPKEMALEINLTTEGNNAVLWYNAGYDITGMIEQMLKNQYPQLTPVDFQKYKQELFQQRGNNEVVAQPHAPVRN